MKQIKRLLIVFTITMTLMGSLFATQELTIQKQCSVNGIDYEQAVSLLQSLQSALSHNDKQSVAGLMLYPLTVNFASAGSTKITRIQVKNKAALLNQWDSVFTKALVQQVSKAKASDLFCNYQGAMVANGAIWLQTNAKQSGVFAINVGAGV